MAHTGSCEKTFIFHSFLTDTETVTFGLGRLYEENRKLKGEVSAERDAMRRAEAKVRPSVVCLSAAATCVIPLRVDTCALARQQLADFYCLSYTSELMHCVIERAAWHATGDILNLPVFVGDMRHLPVFVGDMRHLPVFAST